MNEPGRSGGPLVKVAWARNQAEAELIEGMLAEEGIPSLQRRTRGFDVPDFLAAGPRDILVPAEAEEAARRLLEESPVRGAHRVVADADEPPSTERFAIGFAIALVLAALIVYALYRLAS